MAEILRHYGRTMDFGRIISGRLRRAGLACVCSGALAAVPAAAADYQLQVSATVLPSCNIEAAPLAFGAFAAGADRVDAESAIRLDCTPDLAFTVAMDEGRNGDRRMTGEGSGALLGYDLYTDAARTRRWGGRGTGALSAVAPGDGRVEYAVYGRLDARGASADRYSDVVTITVEF